jgi:hypothetical protein
MANKLGYVKQHTALEQTFFRKSRFLLPVISSEAVAGFGVGGSGLLEMGYLASVRPTV